MPFNRGDSPTLGTQLPVNQGPQNPRPPHRRFLGDYALPPVQDPDTPFSDQDWRSDSDEIEYRFEMYAG